MKIGVIAEDDSDVGVIRELTLRLLRPHKIGFARFVGDGCGKLRRKCAAWAQILVQQGCHWIVVVHDLDTNNEKILRDCLTRAIAPAQAQESVVLIPRREIEAWLLYDSFAIAEVFSESQRLPLPGNPEAIRDPKKYLRDLVRRRYGREYLNTVHNPKIAHHIDTSRLKRSHSFAPHFGFTATIKAALR